MEISPIKLAFLLLFSFLLGLKIGIFYDANRIIRVFCGRKYSKGTFDKLYGLKLPFIRRQVVRKNSSKLSDFAQKTIEAVGDVMCVIATTVGVLVLNYSYNSGRFRFFTVLGALAGFLVYYFTVGKLIMLISEPTVILVKYAFLSVLVIFGYPVKSFFCFALKKLKKCVFLYSFTLEKKKKKIYNIKEKKFLLELAKNGFLDIDITDIR